MVTKISWTKTAVYFAAFIAIGLANSILGPTLPALAENTRYAVGAMGFLFTARALGFMVGALFGGRLYDHLPGHRLMGGMLVVLALGMTFIPSMTHIYPLTIAVFITGLVESSIDIGANTLIVWIFKEKVDPYMNGLHFFFGVGAFLSPIILAQSLGLDQGIKWAYWIPAILILPTALAILIQPSPTTVSSGDDEIHNRVDKKLTGLIMALLFCYVGAEVGFGGWIYTYIIHIDPSQKITAAYMTSVFWGALTVGRLLSIPVAHKLRSRVVLKLDLLGAIVSLSLMLVWPEEMIILWIGTIGLGLSMASIFPTTVSLAGKHMKITGQITGYLFVGSSLGGMTLPWLMGLLLEGTIAQSLFWFLLGTMLVAWFVLIFILRHIAPKAFYHK